MKQKVKPVSPGGMRDYFPGEMIFRNRVIAVIRQQLEGFGFDPLETPALERTEVLTGGNPDFAMSIYRAEIVQRGQSQEEGISDDRETSLRFDLTVPLARLVAANPDKIVLPFKRYQIGQVWRGEKPQVGRYREFMQFDFDTVGASSMLADAEVIQTMSAILRALGIERFMVRFNNRKVLNGLSEVAGFAGDKMNGVLRVLDKLDKIGLEAVVTELRREPDNKFDESALNLDEPAIAKILAFLELSGDTDALLAELPIFFANSPTGLAGIEELAQIVGYLRSAGLSETHWKIDLSVARGLEYYTGPVFETILLDLPEIGSVISGGRFDELVTRFTENGIPATGASVGVDRLFVALEKLNLVPKQETTVQVLVTVLDKKLRKEYIVIAQQLRDAGINTSVYLGDEPLKAQLAYATKRAIPVVVIVGQDEIEAGTITVKDMRKRCQEAIPRVEIISYIQQVLGRV